ncbi:D-alanyl-D-alanine carboxypeptidase family protein [Streptomyces sp. NPDC088146]|uniref:D-alanyl-D-alanine carboxypeptidase family protein n=1 Tax=Streptomyces sp. NPDC088146 TaxID=3365829 RepID=UPI0037F9FA08
MSPRRMEEAPVAGKSPDKSKQQKPSGTARSESDPRLAVFREPSAEAGTGGGTDTATAVFRTEPGLTGAGESGGNGGNGEADRATAVFRARPSEDGKGGMDGVDDIDGKDSERGEGSGESGAQEGSSASSASSAAEGSEGAARDAESVEGASEATEPATEPAEGHAGESVESSGVSEGSEGTEGADGAESVDAGAPGEGDARLRAAVAAWASKDDDEDGKGGKGGESPKGDGVKAEASEASGSAASSDTDTDATAEAGASGASEAVASSDADSDDSDDSGGGADEVSDDASDEVSDEARVSGAHEKVSAAEDAKDAEADAKESAEAEADADAEAGDADEAVAAEDKRGVDQPTAVFRAPAADKIDQPTTALKITPPVPKPDSGSKPESAAEQTSKFVPLRGDDVRPAPAPAPASAPAPAPAPRKPETPAAAASTPGVRPPAPTPGAERTTQQPMPPKPPLDLLAELTNTPPPPQTPVRTAVRRVKIWTPLVLLLLIIFAIVQMVRPLPDPRLGLSAQSAYTFKGDKLDLAWPAQGQSAVSVDGVGSMGSAGAQKPAPIASVAKVMTAYVVLKDHPLTGKEQGEKITVDQRAEDESKREDESTAPITKGQQFTQKQLLQLLMIPSGNNAARLFARWDAPSEAEFVTKMNDAAKDLGMNDTTYTDPSGLEKTTVSTAEDQLKLARAVMQNEVFREIVDTPQIQIPGIDQTIYNNNTILLEPGVSGIKTGSSTPAGGNLLWSANTVVDGKKLWIYGAVMGQQAGTGQPYDSLKMSLDNSLKLIKRAQKAVTSATVVKKGDVVGYVDDGLGGRTPVVATRDLKAKGWSGLQVELTMSDNGKQIPHSAAAGAEVGVVTVGTGPGKVSAPVALQQDLKAPSFDQKLTRIG